MSEPTDALAQLPSRLLEEAKFLFGQHEPIADPAIMVRIGKALRAAATALDQHAATVRALEEARKLAREAVNTWACSARSNRDHSAIADYHTKLDAMERTNG